MNSLTSLRLISPLVVILACASCSTAEQDEEYGHVQDIGMQVVSRAELQSDLSLRAGAVLTAMGIAAVDVAENEVLAMHALWPTCVLRSKASPPFSGIELNQIGCDMAFDEPNVDGVWGLGFELKPNEPGIRYTLGTGDLTVGADHATVTGQGSITEAAGGRTVTWSGHIDALDATYSVLSVDADLSVIVDPATGCRTIDGKATGYADVTVDVTFKGYKVCRPAGDMNRCPTGDMQFSTIKSGALDIRFDGTAKAGATKALYAAAIPLSCTP